jgi:hypothetical protein
VEQKHSCCRAGNLNRVARFCLALYKITTKPNIPKIHIPNHSNIFQMVINVP